jgi:hypothetical protein
VVSKKAKFDKPFFLALLLGMSAVNGEIPLSSPVVPAPPVASQEKRTKPLTRLEDATSADNPMDFFALATMMGKRGDFQGALLSSRIALVYGMYDAKRIDHPSAPEVLQVMMTSLASAIGESGMRRMRNTDNAENRVKALNMLEKLGKPSYRPDYMAQQIQGSTVSTTPPSGFNPDSAWNQIIEQLRERGEHPSPPPSQSRPSPAPPSASP